jgi:hypothetical protein
VTTFADSLLNFFGLLPSGKLQSLILELGSLKTDFLEAGEAATLQPADAFRRIH